MNSLLANLQLRKPTPPIMSKTVRTPPPDGTAPVPAPASPGTSPLRIVAAIHGLLTGETDASWVDHLDAWLLERTARSAESPRLKLLKKEYRAGPWPRWNCWVRNRRLARGLAAEIELLAAAELRWAREQRLRGGGIQTPAGAKGMARAPIDDSEFDPPAIWFVAHSNGAVIALEATKRLIARGHWVAGVILTGAACEGELMKTPLPGWVGRGRLGIAIAYCSRLDRVLAPSMAAPGAKRSLAAELLGLAWRWVLWPYGSLGRTGWLCRGNPVPNSPFFRTRWFQCAHSGYFAPPRRERVFELIYQDITTSRFTGALKRIARARMARRAQTSATTHSN